VAAYSTQKPWLLKAPPVVCFYMRTFGYIGFILKNAFHLAVIGLFSLIIAACSTVPDQPDGDFNLKAQQKRIKSLDTWHIKGRMAFKSETQKNFSAYISWEQKKEDYDFSMNNLLGVSLLKLQGNDSFAEMTYDNQSYDSNNPNNFIEALTGWDIPLLSMQDWIKGMPTAQKGANRDLNRALLASATYDESGRIATFQHNSGWLISYGSYRRVEEHWLPHQVTLKSATSQIRIRITEWTI
jgi:outer membrane lipoprotein LolB